MAVPQSEERPGLACVRRRETAAGRVLLPKTRRAGRRDLPQQNMRNGPASVSEDAPRRSHRRRGRAPALHLGIAQAGRTATTTTGTAAARFVSRPFSWLLSGWSPLTSPSTPATSASRSLHTAAEPRSRPGSGRARPPRPGVPNAESRRWTRKESNTLLRARDSSPGKRILLPAWPRPDKELPQVDLEVTWVRFSTLNHRTRSEQMRIAKQQNRPDLFTADPNGERGADAAVRDSRRPGRIRRSQG